MTSDLRLDWLHRMSFGWASRTSSPSVETYAFDFSRRILQVVSLQKYAWIQFIRLSNLKNTPTTIKQVSLSLKHWTLIFTLLLLCASNTHSETQICAVERRRRTMAIFFKNRPQLIWAGNFLSIQQFRTSSLSLRLCTLNIYS